MSERALINAYVTIEAYLEALTNEELLKLLVKLGGDATTLSRSRAQMLRAVAAEAAHRALHVGDLGRMLGRGSEEEPPKAAAVAPGEVWDLWRHTTHALERLAYQATLGWEQSHNLDWLLFRGHVQGALNALEQSPPQS